MKVKLSAQNFSSPVVVALEFLKTEWKLRGLHYCGPTNQFTYKACKVSSQS